MHSTQNRIDGLTELHEKHHTRVGQAVTIESDASERGTIHVLFEPITDRSAHGPKERRRIRHKYQDIQDIPDL